MALDHDLRVGRHFQGDGLAVGQLDLGAAQQPGELIFGQAFRHRRHGGDDRPRIGADHHGGGDRVSGSGCVGFRPAAMSQPAHQRGVPARHLHAIDADIGTVRPLGHDQRPGDQRRGLSRPAGLDRQFCQIDIVALQHDFLTGGAGNRLRLHRKHRLDHRQHGDGFAPAARRLGLTQKGELLAKDAQLVRFAPHAERNTLDGAEQIDQHRHRRRRAVRPDRVFEQHSRAALGQQAGLDLGHLQHGRDRGGDADQQPVLLKSLDKVSEAGESHEA